MLKGERRIAIFNLSVQLGKIGKNMQRWKEERQGSR